jgi:hypothetical protein
MNLRSSYSLSVVCQIGPKGDLVLWLWDVLASFDIQQREAFLLFVSAKTRLPSTVSDWPLPFKIVVLPSTGEQSAVDASLPSSLTCFFTLKLPQYSSKAVLEAKLSYAISHCHDMDADVRLRPDETGGSH